MLFQKIPVVLLSTIASVSDNSTNCHIAGYLLKNLNQVKYMKIDEMARACNVSVSSISRFCRDIGLEDYQDLKEILNEPYSKYEKVSTANTMEKRAAEYADRMKKCIEQTHQSLEYHKIQGLCRDIHDYTHISVFGLMKAETAAINLQSDLFMLGKPATTKTQYKEQLEYIYQAADDELIILFSYTGAYFEYPFQKLPKGHTSKIYLITGNRQMAKPREADEMITFASDLSLSSHPYQLQYAAHVIAQEYANLISRI